MLETGRDVAVRYTPAREQHMTQSRNTLSVGLSGIIGLALDADLPRSLIADGLRRAAEILCPSHGVRFSMVDERMSIDPTLDEPLMPIDPAVAR